MFKFFKKRNYPEMDLHFIELERKAVYDERDRIEFVLLRKQTKLDLDIEIQKIKEHNFKIMEKHRIDMYHKMFDINSTIAKLESKKEILELQVKQLESKIIE